MKEYTTKEPTDLIETAKMLDDFMKGYDTYGYWDADYSIEQAIDDLEKDPYFIIQELIRMLKEDMD